MEKVKYDEILQLLMNETREEIISIKEFIRTLKNIKLKQKTIINDENYQFHFNSDYGFTYSISIDKNKLKTFNKIFLISYNNHNQQQKFGIRKPDWIPKVLERLSSDELFNKIKSCNGCFYKSGCLHCVVISYKNIIKPTCGCTIEFGSTKNDFAEIKALLKIMDDVYGTQYNVIQPEMSEIYYEFPNNYREIRNNITWSLKNIILDVQKTEIYFDFNSVAKWKMNLVFSGDNEILEIGFQNVIDKIPIGEDGFSGRHTGNTYLKNILQWKIAKLERIDIFPTWWPNAARIDINYFIFGKYSNHN
jgi:hypothetical protein